MSKDYYKILGVEKQSSIDDIKKAFRKLAHKFHPDKKTGDEAKFKEVNEAYQVLGDEEKRKKYDQYGSNFDQQGGFGGGASWDDFMQAARGGGAGSGSFNFGGIDLGDILGDMFGFGGNVSRNRGAQRGNDVQVDVQISFIEAVFGTEQEISLTKNNACDVCSGQGAEPGSGFDKCKACNGQGQVMRVQRTILGAMKTAVQCLDCGGQGQKAKKMCKHCDGVGVVRSKSTYKVKIPAGIDNGQSIRLAGKGEHAGTGGSSGDLYILVHIKEDKNFERRGYDIYTESIISYPQAVLGDQIKIKTVDGDKTFVIPEGTQSHQQFRLKGLGVPNVNGAGRGNHFVKVIIETPRKVNKKIKKLLEELKEEL